jgi:hypothetical protein
LLDILTAISSIAERATISDLSNSVSTKHNGVKDVKSKWTQGLYPASKRDFKEKQYQRADHN